jgi:hypothetical protein
VSSHDLAYLIFGLVLVAALAAIAVRSYSRRRKAQVEEPKYRMLDDDE